MVRGAVSDVLFSCASPSSGDAAEGWHTFWSCSLLALGSPEVISVQQSPLLP